MSGNLRKGWEEKRLGEVANIQTGKLNSNAMEENGKYPFFTCSREIFAINNYAFDCEAILLAGNNASGDFNVKYYKGKFNAYQRTYVITVNSGNKILDSYLNHQLVNNLKKFKEQSLGSNTKFLKLGMIQGMKIPLPPLPEQKRIVAILDEAFSGIARAKKIAEKNLANAKEVFEYYLQGVFASTPNEWKETTIGETTSLNCGFAFKSDGYTNSTSGIKLLRGDNIVQGALRWDDVKKWPANQMKDYNKFELAAGDVILAMDRPWVSMGLKRAMIQIEDLPCLQVQRTARLRAKQNMDNRYLLYLIESQKFINHILGSQTGLGVPHISGQQIQSFSFNLPPLPVQRKTVEHFTELKKETQRLEKIYYQKISCLEELKKSLLQKAFSGELTK